MKAVSLNDSRLLWGIMIYGLIAACWNPAHSSAISAEATNIFMGRQVLTGEFCPLCDHYAGSVQIYPVLSALGDKVGGLMGARAIGAVFVLGLAAVLYLTGYVLFSVKHGLLSALLFLFNGTALYLSRTATGDIVAAFLLGLSFLLLVVSEKQQSTSRCGLLLFTGAVSLFFSAVTKYTVALFIVPLVIYVFWKHKFWKALLFFFLPLSIFLSAYVYFAVLPGWNSLMEILFNPYGGEFLPAGELGSRIFRWLGMPYLLAVFGLFHEERKGIAFLFIALSAPLVVFHIISGDVRALDRDVIYSIVFLVPAMALGVDHMGSLFSLYISSTWVKPFFTVAVLIVLWVFGIHEFMWLQTQHPDLTRVMSFLNQRGFDGMTVAIDADKSDADYLYRYSLEKSHPFSRFIQISDDSAKDRERVLRREKPDFVVFDETIDETKTSIRTLPRNLDADFSLVEKFYIPFSVGVQNIKIFRRR
jgi:4-amino-4-deoxy-L-arabinose transferase-like glycosyltransferase